MATTDSGRMGAFPHPYSTAPASPTLTNPDMILPEYEGASFGSLDSEDGHNGNAMQSPLMMWKNAQAAASGPDLQQLFGNSSIQQTHPDTFTAGPVTPTTPIIYGNGTMLSDIGEVTEVESTVGKPSPESVRRRGTNTTTTESLDSMSSISRSPSPILPQQRLPLQQQQQQQQEQQQQQQQQHLRHQHHFQALKEKASPNNTPRRSSPTIGDEHLNQKHTTPPRNNNRRDSIDSNTTITTTEDQAGLFADFDDAISVGDSVFQGDDEESVAESYMDERYSSREPPGAPPAVAVGVGGGLPASLLHVPALTPPSFPNDYGSDVDERRHSAASLSRRAEQILANAKKRLTTMEDNLSRARSTLYVTSPTIGSLASSDGSSPSAGTPVRAATALASRRRASPGHARLASDGAMTATMSASMSKLQQTSLQRSASAMGAAGGYRQPSVGARSVEQIRESLRGNNYVRPSYSKPAEMTLALEPLDEDMPHEGTPTTTTTTTSPPNSGQLENFLSPTFGGAAFHADNGLPGVGAGAGLTRSASAAQMRDIKDHVKDLKGKISSLRDQARADTMKRRSLQSLRTPSPFTHSRVEQWYAEPQPFPGAHTGPVAAPAVNHLESSPVPVRSPWNGELSSVEGDDRDDEINEINEHDENDEYDERSSTPTPGAVPVSAVVGGRFSVDERNDEQEDAVDAHSIIDSYDSDHHLSKLKIPGSYHAYHDYSDESPVLGGDRGQIDDDMQTENGDVEEERPRYNHHHHGDMGYESESGESLYHDSVQHQISHEDREDAFDYEHFILHSALGTISQQRLRHARSDSFSSEDSVETTRGPVLETTLEEDEPLTPRNVHGNNDNRRRSSFDSISTVDSFATATEGRNSRVQLSSGYDSDDVADEDDDDDDSHDDGNRDSVLTACAVPISATAVAAAAAAAATTTSNRSRSSSSAGGFHHPRRIHHVHRNSTEEPRQTQQPPVTRRPASSAAAAVAATSAMPTHRPSTSSFESIGTTRSFPLVSRQRLHSNGAVAVVGGGSGGNTSSAESSNGRSNTSSPSVRGVLPTTESKSISDAVLAETASIVQRSKSLRHHDGSSNGTDSPRHQTPDSDRSNHSNHSTNRSASLRLHSRVGSSASTSTSSLIARSDALQTLPREDQYVVERLVSSLGQCVVGLSEHGRASSESRAYRRRLEAARRILEGTEPV